jgi:hypothetical protein
MAAKSYYVNNGPMVTTAAPAKVTTGTSIKTMLQLVGSTPFRVIEWGCSFDGTAAATPGIVELVTTGSIASTVTAFAVADVQPYGDPNAPANTSGTSGVPLNLGTALSGYTSTSEGSIVATRQGDTQLIAPTGEYFKQFPLGREFEVKAAEVLRVRMTFGTAVNALVYVIFEV